MEANAVSVLGRFEKKLRLEVPLFQRQYVWSRLQQWEPLWEDIARKFNEYLNGRHDAPIHFLGAMVLDQKQTPTTHVERRQVIDGQQRLTTLQLFLAAFRDFCRENNLAELANECESYTFNKGILPNADVDKFKVWPTQADREQFRNVVGLGSRVLVEKQYPIVRKKYARKPDPRPRMVEAYLFFHASLREFFNERSTGSEEIPPVPLASAVDQCLQALKNALKVVVIDLGAADDAQVIFETLNARGEPLLPADLVRNYIFLRAGRNGEPQDSLYQQFWSDFDLPFWRHEIKQGRVKRPRSDLFFQHFLSSEQLTEIPIGHLFVEYKHWIESSKPFGSVGDELRRIAKQRDNFHRLVQPRRTDHLWNLAVFLERFEVSPVYPLILLLLAEDLNDHELNKCATIIESYLVRRSVCGLTNKNYNRTFLLLARALRFSEVSSNMLVNQLAALKGESVEFPSNQRFQDAWLQNHAYRAMNNPKLSYIFVRLSETFGSNRTEDIEIKGDLTVEHILPQVWIKNWPLPDGAKGVDRYQTEEQNVSSEIVEASRRRDELLQTMGNLTLITGALNSSNQNAGWTEKREALLKHSLLPINLGLQKFVSWDEESILQRGTDLYRRAITLWPDIRPS